MVAAGVVLRCGGAGGRRPRPDDLLRVYQRGGVGQVLITYPFNEVVFPPEIIPPELLTQIYKLNYRELSSIPQRVKSSILLFRIHAGH